MPYYWSDNATNTAGRINQVERVDMTSTVDAVTGGDDLFRLDRGRVFRHTKVIVQMLRAHVRTESGFVAVAMIESFSFPMSSIVCVLKDILPDATVAYFRETKREWDGKVLDILHRIFRPAQFESTIDEQTQLNYDFFEEMKALGIPTFLHILQVLHPLAFTELAARTGAIPDTNAHVRVRDYMARFV